jgi:hypothetical protein
MDPITVTGVTAGQVHDWLTRVLPHLGDDDTLPFLTRVQITIGDGHLLAAATDRYTFAATHLPANTGAGRACVTIPGEWAREIAAELGGHRIADVPAVLTLAGDRFTIDLPSHHDEDFEPYFDGEWNTAPTEPGTEWVKWQALVRLPLSAPADPTPVPVRADLLARFTAPGALILNPAAPTVLTAVTPGPGLPPLTVHSPAGAKTLVLLGPGFLGLLAVLRLRPEHPALAAPPLDPDGWHAAWADIIGAPRAAVPA